MDAPVYTATVQSERGWTFQETHGQPPAPDADTYLVDPLNLRGAFEEQVIPNPIEPHTATVNLWSRNARVRPLVRRGDVFRITLRLGGPAGPVVADLPMRVTEVNAELVPSEDYPYRASITLTDLLVNLGSYFPTPRAPGIGAGVAGLGNRFAWVGAAGGYSVGVPTGFIASIQTGTGLNWLRDVSAREEFRLLLNTCVPPGGKHHVITPYLGNAYPAGYAHPGAAVGGPNGAAVPDPNSSTRLMVQPASRNLDYATSLPLRFAKANNRLELAGATGVNRMPAVPARACVVPAVARQGREHAPNAVRLIGKATNVNGVPTDPANLESDSTLDVTLPDAATAGYRGREVQTLTPIREYGDDPATAGPAFPPVVALAQSYLADASTLARDWTFDGITVYANELTDAEAASVLPILTPAYLDAAGRDGRLVRHLTIYGIDPDARLDGDTSTIDGFVVAWEVEITGGELIFTLTTTPGRPPTTATPVTLGEFVGAAYSSGLTARQIEPNITVADLDLVD